MRRFEMRDDVEQKTDEWYKEYYKKKDADRNDLPAYALDGRSIIL